MSVVRVPLTLTTWGLRSLSGLRGYWNGLSAVRGIVKRHDVGWIHCGRCLPEGLIGWVLKKLYGLPYICFVYGEELNYAAASRELTWMMRRVLRSADFVIAISKNTERIVREEWGLPQERIRLLYPGVDTGHFVPAERSARDRAELNWGNRPVLLTVGRLQKRKGHDQMILALKQVKKTIPDVLYAIAGDGEERAFLENLVATEGLQDHVQFLGEVGDAGLLRCYQQCDVFVLPNRQVGADIEGFGIVLVEAQACGKPVIAGKSGGTAETMQEPITGRIVDCTTPGPLAAVLTDLLADPTRCGHMGKAARTWAAAQFDWSSLSRRAADYFACA